jgi:hypothetical protein
MSLSPHLSANCYLTEDAIHKDQMAEVCFWQLGKLVPYD